MKSKKHQKSLGIRAMGFPVAPGSEREAAVAPPPVAESPLVESERYAQTFEAGLSENEGSLWETVVPSKPVPLAFAKRGKSRPAAALGQAAPPTRISKAG